MRRDVFDLKLNISLNAFIVFCGSSFFLIYAPVNPLFVILLFSFFLSVVKRELEFDLYLVTLFIIFVALSLPSLYYSSQYSLQPIVYILFSLLTGLLMKTYTRNMDIHNREYLLRHYSYFIILYTGIDTALRYIYPNKLSVFTESDSVFWFYQYKTSWILSDSNSVAIIVLSCLFLRISFFLKLNSRLKFGFIEVLLSTILLLTISRAAIFSGLLTLLLIYVLSIRNKYLLYALFIPVIMTLCSMFLYLVFEFASTDGSGSTKLHELQSVVRYLNNGDVFGLLFGVGLGNGEAYSGRYLHGLYSKVIIESGLLFTLIFAFIITKLCLKDKHVFFYLLPLVISSFSFSFYIIVPFFVSSIVLLDFKRDM